MNTLVPLQHRASTLLSSFSFFTLALAITFSTACGSSGSMSSSRQTFSGNTSATVLLTSTSNDQLVEFNLGFSGMTLTNQSGSTVTLLPAKAQGGLGAELMHMNGIVEPLVNATIPQDIYTAATVTLSSAEFACIGYGLIDGEPTMDSAFYNSNVPASAVTVNLPSPITVTGASMGFDLDLVVSQSATIGSCLTPDGFAGFSLTPAFNLTSVSLPSSAANSASGKVMGLDGQITAMGMPANSFTAALPSAEGSRPLSVSVDENTVYQGIGDFSALAVGSFVNMDGAIQANGSVLATRVAVEDPSAVDAVRGPLTFIGSLVPVLSMHGREQQGKDFPGYVGGFGYFNFGTATFQISGQLTNLVSLPFMPTFNASNIVPGQEAYITTLNASPITPYPVATTVTLMPQTIDGTITASSQSGNSTAYTVSLAPYDLFPALAVQPGQTTLLTNPGQVEVYLDGSTQLLNAQSLDTGNTFRFYGLVFNDNGTLRMDCAQVNDGVSFSPPPPSSSQRSSLKTGVVRETRQELPGGAVQANSVIKQQP